MSILLTDEEMDEVENSLGSEDWRFGEAIAKVQLKKMVDYIENIKWELSPPNDDIIGIRKEDWLRLKGE